MTVVLAAIRRFAHHALGSRPASWEPLLAVYYLTYDCDLRCPYCSDGSGLPYHRLSSPVLDAARAVELLARVRRRCEHVVLTGGEPLGHPEAGAVLEGLPALGFDGVILTTNGLHLGAHLPAVARAVTELVVSVDTLDERRADAIFGRGPGVFARVHDNLARADRLRPRRYRIVVSSVVTPDNIDDLYAVQGWAAERGYRFAACPQLVGVKAHPALVDDPAYRRFFDHLLAEKRRGRDIEGTVAYLERMRDLPRFRCRPFTMLVLSPVGEVFYPCLEIGRPAGNLLEDDDLDRLRREGERRYGPQPDCDTRCHSACALGFATVLEDPLSLVGEAYLRAKGRLLRR